MKLVVFLVISCLALHSGAGAPRTAVYKFVKCNPNGDQANCVTQQSPIMAWTPDLPAKLPASTALYLEAEPEEGESPPSEEEVELEMDEKEKPMMSDEGESPVETEDGSGAYEGSAAASMADLALGETGSGESWADWDQFRDGGIRGLVPGRPLAYKAKPRERKLTEDRELREDHLLQL